MIENLAALSGRRPIAVIVFAIVLVVLGIYSWKHLSVDLFPDLQSPTIIVSVESGSRPVEQMERLYGERVEQLLFTVPGISTIDQVVRSGQLICRVTFTWKTNVDIALVEVNRAVASIIADPEVNNVKVRRFDTRQLPVLVLGLSSESSKFDLADLRSLVKRQLAPSFEKLTGVAEARASGGRVKQVEVQLDTTRLTAYGITINEVRNKIRASNIDFNAGTIEEADQVLLVRGRSRFISPQDIEKVVVRYLQTKRGEMTAVTVADVAQIKVNDEEINHLVRINGEEGVGLFLYKEAGANTVEVSQLIHQAIQKINHDFPEISVKVISDQAAFVSDAISDVQSAAFLGILLSIIVLIFFLRSPGSVMIVAIAIPVSLLATAIALDIAGQTLNLMTMGGLALGTGMLVDNAIVVTESIYRQRSEGKSVLDAAKIGTGRVGGAIIASTLTTCIVFLPVLFIQGMASKLVAGLSFTVVISLIASLFVAIFLIPALSIGFLPKRPVKTFDPGNEKLEFFIFKLLEKPTRVVVLTTLLIVISVAFLIRMGSELLPPQDPRQFSLEIAAPPGQKIESTVNNVANVEAIISSATGDDLNAILSEVGRIEDDDRIISEEYSAENTAVLQVKLNAGESTASSIVKSASPAIEKLYGTQVNWKISDSALSQAMGNSGPAITIQIVGHSLDDLRDSADMIRKALESSPVLWNIKSSFDGAPREVHLKLNRKVADALGINEADISSVIEAALNGLKVTTLTQGDENKAVLITIPNVNVEQLMNLTFHSENGELFTIGEVASVEFKPGAKEILRHNQRRMLQVTALISPQYSYPQAQTAVQNVLSSVELPFGITTILAGEEKERKQTINELSWAGGLALLMVFMVLAGTLESLLLPIAILSAFPIALIGVALVIVPQAQPLGVMTILGLVVLMGIAVNDAILLAQTTRGLTQQGVNTRNALAKAVALRLRPIIMTSATTILSLLPLAMGAGEGAELRAPLAWTIVGGILASTIGCILVIPCVYLSLDKMSRIKQIYLRQAHDSV